MTDTLQIPANIQNRLNHFTEEVNRNFHFLSHLGFQLEKIESGRTDNFLDYYCYFSYQNGDTTISIRYSTDIINGQTTALPQVDQRPIIDNQVSCSISDSNAFMNVSQFAQITQPKLPENYFTIEKTSDNIKADITKVVQNYAHFFNEHLNDVLQKKKIYNCYVDRFYDTVFNEKHYC
jgi:hypothetical protein